MSKPPRPAWPSLLRPPTRVLPVVALLFLVSTISLATSRSIAAPHDPPELGKLVYVSGGDLWWKELPDGLPQRLATGGNLFRPQWSASGQWLSYLKGVERNAPETWVMRSDGTEARKLDAMFEGPNAPPARWSPSGDRLLFVTTDGDIVAEDAGGGRTMLVTRDRANSHDLLSYPMWSPDGTSIAFARESRPNYEALWRFDIRDGSSKELYNYLPPDGQIVPARWSPDGTQVYFWRSPIYSASIMADGLPLWSVPAGIGPARALGVTTLLYGDYLTLSPTGEVIAVDGGGRESLNNKRLIGLDATGKTPLTVNEAAAISPALSPDAKTIALVGSTDTKFGARGLIAPMADRRIWLTAADGGNATRLTVDEDSGEEGPQWSRDGDLVLYVKASFAVDRTSTRMDATLNLIGLTDDSPKVVAEGLGLDLNLSYGGFYYSHVDWSYLFDWWQAP